MEGRIGRLHCRYRLVSGSATNTIGHLDAVGRDGLAEACARSLEQIMAGDPSVWIVRNVSVPLTLNLRGRSDDASMSQQWAKRIATAAVREVAKGADGTNVVRFENQPDLLASFLADLLRDQAWGQWFYGCFERFREERPSAVASAVLLENREHIPEVLVRLAKSGSLEPLLQLLPHDVARQIWNGEGNGYAGAREEELRPLFAAALWLAERCGNSPANQGRSVADQWLREYMESQPSAPDWRDRSGLPAAVVAALEFLWRRGHLRSSVAEIANAWRARGAQPGGDFEWLDPESLEDALSQLESLERAAVQRPAQAAGPALRFGASTPRLRRLVAELTEAIADDFPGLAKQQGDAADALRIYSRLLSRSPGWSGDPLALRAIEGLLATAAWISGAGGALISRALSSPGAWRDLGAGQLRGRSKQGREDLLRSEAEVLRKLPGVGDDQAADLRRLSKLNALRNHSSAEPDSVGNSRSEDEALSSRPALSSSVMEALKAGGSATPVAAEFLRTFGDRGLELALAVATGSLAAETTGSAGVETRCAGVFLMVRAISDARLASAARLAGYPLAPCILMLGLCWAGEEAILEGRLDDGVGLLAGQGAPISLDELRSIWSAADPASHMRFQAQMLRMLVSRCVLGSGSVELHRLTLAGGSIALVFGIERLWPLVHVVPEEAGEVSAIAAMTELWSEATGERPEVVAADEESTRALRQSLEALGSDRLDLPLADLTLALTANSLLRVWAVWLRQFSQSSVPYLLQNFIRRPGRIITTQDGLLVKLAPRPLDIVLEMAGYVAPFQAMQEPWECKIAFRIEAS